METILQQSGQLFTVGFQGTHPDDVEVRKVLSYAEQGLIGGVILFRYNIVDKAQLQTLTAAFHTIDAPHPLFIFVDQEGGRVQRIKEEHGFHDYPSAHCVAQGTPEEARSSYQAMAADLRSAGFTINCAPCIDLDGETSSSPAIGALERSYGCSSDAVVAFAEQLIAAQEEQGILSCLKHFPGHGRACGDTHEGLIDISNSWSEEELEPYEQLLKSTSIDAVMTAHLKHNTIDPDYPATLSRNWLQKLRQNYDFKGIIVSDDLHMGAIIEEYSMEELLVTGIHAGLDVLMFSNNPLASKAQGIRHDVSQSVRVKTGSHWIVPDNDLPQKLRQVVEAGLQSDDIKAADIEQAYERIVHAKSHMWTAA